MLIPSHVIFFWLIFTSSATVALLIVARRMLEASAVRSAFLACLGSYLCFSLPLLTVFLQTPSDPYVRFTSQMIHAGGIMYVYLLGRFVITIAKPEETSSYRFRLFELNYIVLFIASFAGFIEQGVTIGQSGLAPVPGPLMPYFNLSMVAYSAYFLTVCGVAYKTTSDQLLLCQLRAIFWTALPAFSMLMITNSIIPGITGDFQATPAGALWVLLCFAGVGYILSHGKHLLLDQSIRTILKVPHIKSEETSSALRSFVSALGESVTSPHAASTKNFTFKRADSSEAHVTLDTKNAESISPTDGEARALVDAMEDISALSPMNALLAYTLEHRKRTTTPTLKKKLLDTK